MRDPNLYFSRSVDIEILFLINIFRFLPLRLLTKLLIDKGIYTKYQAVARSVNRLEKLGLIRFKFYADHSKIIFLSRNGARLLSQARGIPEDSINCPDRLSGVNLGAIEHTLKVADLYYLFFTECQKFGFELIQYRGDNSIRYPYEFQMQKRGGGGTFTIRRIVAPDAEIKIRNKENILKTFFVEYDRGTEFSKDVAEKYQKYFELYFLTDYDKRDEFPSILFIAENTMQRIKNLIPYEGSLTNFGDYDLRDKNNVVLKGVFMNQIREHDYQYYYKQFLKDANKFLFIEYSNLKANGFNAKWLNYNQQEKTLINE